MWSDTLLFLERAHLARLLAWGVVSVVAGTAVFALLIVRRLHSPLLGHFAFQTLGWGAATLAITGLAWRRLALRDFAGARELDRLLWLNLGLDVGYVAVGVTLGLTGWLLGRRLGPVGAGVAIVLQGTALFVLDGYFAGVLGRVT